MKKDMFSKKLLLLIGSGYFITIIFLWLNETLDIPHRLLGAKPTPANLTESIFESAFILGLGVISMTITSKSLKRIKYLEGFLRLCSHCKKVYTRGEWIPIADYLRNHSEAQFTHGLCPECADKYYQVPES